jgi:hypothetical protein
MGRSLPARVHPLLAPTGYRAQRPDRPHQADGHFLSISAENRRLPKGIQLRMQKNIHEQNIHSGHVMR